MSVIRIGGLATGLDTYQMIQDLMKVHRKPVDRLRQERQVLEWRREDYRGINSALLNFRNGTVFSMRLSSTFLAKTVASSNPAAVTATASPGAAKADYAVTVTSLATTAYKASTGTVSASGADKVDPDATLWSQRAKFGSNQFGWNLASVAGENIAGTGTNFYQLAHAWITPGSAAVKVVYGTGGEQVYQVYYTREAYNAGVEAHKVLVDTNTGALEFNQVVAEGDTVVAGYEYNTRTFDFSLTTYNQNGTPNNRTFTVDAVTETLNGVLNRISADSALGLVAFYEGSSDRVSVSTTRTGDNNAAGDEIGVGTTGFLAEVLRLGTAVEQGGTNARITLNGLDITRPTNEFSLNNVHFSLKATGTATLTVRSDTAFVFQHIRGFIDAYNGILDLLNGKLQEERFRDYLPLLDDDPARERMTEKQIDQWEQKARSGLLRHDSLLSSIVNRLRTDVFTPVSGLGASLNHLVHIGITVGSFADQGKLVIDEAKLRRAIEQDPEGVARLFNQSGTTNEEQGIGHRLYGYLDTAIKQLTARAGSPTYASSYDPSWLGRQISMLDERMQRTEERLEKLEDRYWKQFTALERAISRMNAQSMWLAQQFGGGMFQG
ncbi:flagellar filament capping protein FliD [Candidatus Desulforudis audaxviator]|uniref:Flagellar hook-associated protein 2 n=1 Tax=Desulforudis audaxviator (strain MP104C) TaxID=477974 RepID=B1I5H1_DESAP|nr:flagellar filament capping protein FliD [Candidatus Desulforudis audaxviator]ACA60279.1 flagellar hook-associated 2 domain protein [Candidatus Desulforudis audaxviator MP104C]AZK60326.1 Flagellar hook-associated protein FliD [Candidatus Desulforudis audaxviator]